MTDNADYAAPIWEECGRCMEHYLTQPFLTESFASVGIEHGKSTYEMAVTYFAHIHSTHRRKRKTTPDEVSTP